MVHTVRHRPERHVITDRDTGRSRGFGFVEMDTDAQAQAAIQGLHDLEHEGRWLIVIEAKPGDDRGGAEAAVVATAVVGVVSRMGFNGSPFLLDPERVPRVFCLSFRNSIVGKNPYVATSPTTSTSPTWRRCSPSWAPAERQIIVDRDTNRSKGFGFVEMDTDAQAQAAIQGLHDQASP